MGFRPERVSVLLYPNLMVKCASISGTYMANVKVVTIWFGKIPIQKTV